VNTLWRNRVFEWHRWFNDGRDVQDHPKSGQAKTQRKDANVDRVRTLVRSDRRGGVKVIAEQLNMNRETVRQIVKEDLEWGNFPKKWCRELWHDHDQKRRLLIFHAMQMCLIVIIGDETWCLQCDPETKQHSTVENTEFTSVKKIIDVSIAGQEHACVFLRSQEDSSLRIHCKRTNCK